MKLDLYPSLGSKYPDLLFAALCSLLLALAPIMARADINLVAPSRTIDPAEPLRLSLMVTGEADSRDYALPEVLRVSLTPDLGAAANVELQRATPVPDTITLRSGEFMRIDYVGTVPPTCAAGCASTPWTWMLRPCWCSCPRHG
jgi:hypothetical protein